MKYIRFLGPRNRAVKDAETGLIFKGQGEAHEVTAEKAKELEDLYPGKWEETTKDNAAAKSSIISEPVRDETGAIRYVDPANPEVKALTPIHRVDEYENTDEEVKE